MVTTTWSLIFLVYTISDVSVQTFSAAQIISSHVLDVSSCEMQGNKQQVTTETEQDCKFECLDRFETGKNHRKTESRHEILMLKLLVRVCSNERHCYIKSIS